MEYRVFLTLTDEEISFILVDIFGDDIKIENIQKDDFLNQLLVEKSKV